MMRNKLGRYIKGGPVGKKNPAWKGGHSKYYNAKTYTSIIRTFEQKCSMCGTKKKLIAHHVDGNSKHNILSNLMIVCKGCHNKIHRRSLGKRAWSFGKTRKTDPRIPIAWNKGKHGVQDYNHLIKDKLGRFTRHGSVATVSEGFGG